MAKSLELPYTGHHIVRTDVTSFCEKNQLLDSDMGAASREYEFFVTTDEPHQPHGVERGRIRRLVMRNFFETKCTGSQASTSEHNSASTVQAGKQLKARFRLSKVNQESGNSKPRRRDVRQDQGTGRKTRPRAARTVSESTCLTNATDGSGHSTASPSVDEHSVNAYQSDAEATSRQRSKGLVIKANPGAHRFDPFDVLPVPGTSQLDCLFRLCKPGSKINSIATNAKHSWWKFISSDAGLLHATLATWALYGMLMQGMDGLEVQKLKHKNEAIKEINFRIGMAPDQISDELVGTVLTMASLENMSGAYDAAQLHVAALRRMVTARGGLFAFGHNDGLIRGLIWVDFHTAAAFHTSPSFPRIRLDPDTPPLPDGLLEEAACTSPTSLLQLPLGAVDCFNIFYRLHRLALATSLAWLPRVDRLTISNLLYETEHAILQVPDHSRTFLDFDLETGNESDETFQSSRTTANAAAMVEALLAAAQIFMFAALRDLPTNTKLFSILLERLRIALNRPRIDVGELWKQEHNLHVLLWVLVVACSVAPPLGENTWWIQQLAQVMAELKITERFELEMELQRVAWMDTFFAGPLSWILDEVVMATRGSCGMSMVSGECQISLHRVDEWDLTTFGSFDDCDLESIWHDEWSREGSWVG